MTVEWEMCNCEITDVYGRDEAYEVKKRSREDYMEKYKNLADLLENKY
jgi:hypothetical protein